MNKKQFTTLISLWVIAICLGVYSVYVTFINRGYTEVNFIDVEQGDSCFIQTDHLKNILIDGGDDDFGTYTVLPFVKSKSAHHLDAVFVSHMHDDHIQGVLELIDADFPILHLYISKNAEHSSFYDELYEAAEENKIPVTELSGGDCISIDDATFTVIDNGNRYTDENDNSLILKFDYGENSVLFTGDTTKTAESYIVESGADISSDILKIAHHGSAGSSSSDFIKSVNPYICVISVGKDNDYGHPSKKTLLTLSAYEIPTLRTDYDGTISIKMTEDKITDIHTSRNRGIKQ